MVQQNPRGTYNPLEWREVVCLNCGANEFKSEPFVKIQSHRFKPTEKAVITLQRILCGSCGYVYQPNETKVTGAEAAPADGQ
jgi:uncharacterized CHY-type Zn-finger protein